MNHSPNLNFDKTLYDEEDFLIINTNLKALLGGEGWDAYQVGFYTGLTVKLKREVAIDKIIGSKTLSLFSKSPDEFIVVTPNRSVIANMKIFQKPGYSSMYCKCWAKSREEQKAFETELHNIFKDDVTKGVVCGIQWAFTTSKGMQTVYIEESFDDVVIEEAYPEIIRQWGTIENFISAYLESDEAILILQGPPGTGKSRLIRKILALLASQFNFSDSSTVVSYKYALRDAADDDPYNTGLAPSLALYTGDMKVLESDEIFAKFLTSEERVFIVEDADHALMPRNDGNKDLHRFLTVSDGIIKSIGRKVIFTTNLPNLESIDDALVRPGRCFARIHLGNLKREEVVKLLDKFELTAEEHAECLKRIFYDGKPKSLAEIYKSVKEVKHG